MYQPAAAPMVAPQKTSGASTRPALELCPDADTFGEVSDMPRQLSDIFGEMSDTSRQVSDTCPQLSDRPLH
ncbi:hypothetical protein [Sporosarcina trichiuri]|uniref:hypothetical protein n=1 Tax=Sporosarcina trichiuri TaxID=3056445 RepID=UPI0025B2BB99|nr:hypothetical protein [Sporosarcina sp. 0.2-SM1T-5]WJY27616.1 hypothetical protein QWT68_00945 [Sporosarcina sp. 0.2-SM1T-5]